MVGSFEVVCGLLVVFGLYTRYATFVLIHILFVANIPTKISNLLGVEIIGFSLKKLEYYGLLSLIQESRDDMDMLIGSIFLLIKDGGMYLLEHRMFRSSGEES